jgi:hypothetical protein
MKVDVVDGSGNRYTVTFAGNVTRDKAMRLLEIVELLGGMPENTNLESSPRINELSKFNKIRLIVEKHFPIVWFTSIAVKAMYEQEFREPIGLSTVSTYLSRMTQRGFITENSISNHKRYKILTGISRNELQTVKSNK